MKWITRERPKIDRIACPWLIKNFVDSKAEFIYVSKDQVFEKAVELNAIPYDIPGAEYSHYGDECTFDFILKKHELNNPVLNQLATMCVGPTPIVLTLLRSQQVCGPFPPGFLIIIKTIMSN